MRYLDTMPAWVVRQRSRRLVRHSDEKVVRWINHNPLGRDEPAPAGVGGGSSSNDNVVRFASNRPAQAF